MAFNIVLVEPEIPPNTGNIGRLCVATGSLLHLVEPLGFKIDDASVKRAGLDYWEFVKLFTYPTFQALKETYPNARFIYTSKCARKVYTEIKYEDGDFLVFGKETKGLPKELIKENEEFSVHIPMFGPVRSINLANAVSIILYEALRQVKGF